MLRQDDFRSTVSDRIVAALIIGAYAAHHGFPDYLSMHFQLLHPSTPPEVAQHHLQAAWGTTESAPDNVSESEVTNVAP
jgi:hypothetical protein